MAIGSSLYRKILGAFGNGPGTELVTILNNAGADDSWNGTSVTATGAVQGATVVGTTSVRSPSIGTDAGTADILFGSDGSEAQLDIVGDGTTSYQLLAGATSIAETITSATGEFETRLTDNIADAWSIKITGGADLLTFKTTTGATAVTPVAGIGAAGGFTASPRLCHTGGVPAQTTSFGTNTATNTAGTVYLAEVFVPCNMTATGVAVFNGTAVAGNGKVMLYDSAGNRLAISASTLMAGTLAYQLIPFTAALAVKGPATYFIGTIYDDTAHDLRGHTIGSFAVGTDAGNTYGTESTYATVTLPTTFSGTTGPVASLY